MLRSTVAAAVVAALLAPTAAFAADAPPTAPGNARATLYAGAGGELFWTRSTDDRGVRGYEITRNGQSLGTRDATSFYDASLKANVAYTFTVTAIDTAGQRSPAATVRLGGASAVVQPASAPASPAPTASASGAPAPAAGAPAAPVGLRASVYSAANAELFWARPATPGLRYEVRRDGAVVATTDGVSHYATGLVAGRDYAWQVVAIDRSGRRSAPASVTVRTGGAGGQAAAPASPAASMPTAPAAPGGQLAAIAPANARIVVYSVNAAELFWRPAEGILRNEVRRNGTLLGTTPGGSASSFFDDTRRPGEPYTYEITAFSTAGRASVTVASPGASAPGAQTGGGSPAAPSRPGPAPTPAATPPAATRTRLDNQFDLMNAVALEKVGALAARLADPAIYRPGSSAGLRSVGFDDVDPSAPSARVETFACPKGGGIRDGSSSSGPREPGDANLQAIDCAIGPIVFSGLFTVDANRSVRGFAGPSTYVSASGVEIDDSRDLSTIRVSDSLIEFGQGSRVAQGFWSMAGVAVELPDRSYSARQVYGDGADRGNALPDGSTGLTVDGEDLNGAFGRNASLRTRGPFEFRDGRAGGRPTAGRATLASAEGGWTIDAFNGDPASFQLNADAGGTTTSTTVAWSARYRLDAPSVAGVDVGF